MHFEAALSGRAYVELLDGRSTWGPLVQHLKLDGPKDARRVMSVCSSSLLFHNGGVYAAGSIRLLPLSKPTVNGKLCPPQLPDGPRPSAMATRLLPPNPNFPSTAYLRIQKSGMFFELSAVVLTHVDRLEGLPDATLAWLLPFSAL